MAQLKSYRSLGERRKGGGDFLDAWKEKGFVNVFPHREPPYERRVHNMWHIEEVEKEGRKLLVVKWRPVVCWEPDKYHALKKSKQPMVAQTCPTDRWLEWLDENTRIPDDEVVLRFEVGKKDTREILKADALGRGNYRNKMTAVSEYVFAVIPADDPSGVYLTNEKWSLGQSFFERNEKNAQKFGGERADPERCPVGLVFEYSEEKQEYSVSNLLDSDGNWVRASDKVWDLWEGPAPDADIYCKPGDPNEVLAWFKDAAAIKMPIDDFFGPAIEEWEKTHRSSGESRRTRGDGRQEDDRERRDDRRPEGRSEGRREERRVREPREERRTEERGSERERRPDDRGSERESGRRQDWRRERPREDDRGDDRRSERREERREERRVREPREERRTEERGSKTEIVQACGKCGGDWKVDEPVCPHCGAMPADGGESGKGESRGEPRRSDGSPDDEAPPRGDDEPPLPDDRDAPPPRRGRREGGDEIPF